MNKKNMVVLGPNKKTNGPIQAINPRGWTPPTILIRSQTRSKPTLPKNDILSETNIPKIIKSIFYICFLEFPAHLAIKNGSGTYVYPHVGLTTRPEMYSVGPILCSFYFGIHTKNGPLQGKYAALDDTLTQQPLQDDSCMREGPGKHGP